jgi:hypothetical protein
MKCRGLIKILDFVLQYHKHLDCTEQFVAFVVAQDLQYIMSSLSYVPNTTLKM